MPEFDKSKVDVYPDTEFTPVSHKELDKQAKEQMSEFSDLLGSLDKSLDKKKRLWKQIYENAVVDRKTAYMVFADLYVHVHCKPNEHAIHGPTLSKYMERMSKATEHLLKLAELVALAETKVPTEERLEEEDIYNSIKSKKPKH